MNQPNASHKFIHTCKAGFTCSNHIFLLGGNHRVTIHRDGFVFSEVLALFNINNDVIDIHVRGQKYCALPDNRISAGLRFMICMEVNAVGYSKISRSAEELWANEDPRRSSGLHGQIVARPREMYTSTP